MRPTPPEIAPTRPASPYATQTRAGAGGGGGRGGRAKREDGERRGAPAVGHPRERVAQGQIMRARTDPDPGDEPQTDEVQDCDAASALFRHVRVAAVVGDLDVVRVREAREHA